MKTASVALATMVLATAAFAANAQPVSGNVLTDLIDTDRDGGITRQEAAAARQHVFERFDRNGDGTVDEAKVETVRQAIYDRAAAADAWVAIRWSRLDGDGDGKVSAAEFQASSSAFSLADRNGDGVVAPDEIEFLRDLFGRAR